MYSYYAGGSGVEKLFDNLLLANFTFNFLNKTDSFIHKTTDLSVMSKLGLHTIRHDMYRFYVRSKTD